MKFVILSLHGSMPSKSTDVPMSKQKPGNDIANYEKLLRVKTRDQVHGRNNHVYYIHIVP